MLSNGHRAMSLALLALAGPALLPHRTESQLTLPLELSHQEYDPREGEVEFVLTNTGKEPIVAWGLHVHYMHDNGELTELSFLQDFEESEAEGPSGEDADLHLAGALLPEQSHRGTLSIPRNWASPVSSVSLFVRLVVFSGGESLGDEALSTEIFSSRRAARLAESYWLVQFKRALSQSRSAEDLALHIGDMMERLDSGSEIYSGDGVTSGDAAARSREKVLRRYLESLLEEATQPGSSVDLWASFAELVNRTEQRQEQTSPPKTR